MDIVQDMCRYYRFEKVVIFKLNTLNAHNVIAYLGQNLKLIFVLILNDAEILQAYIIENLLLHAFRFRIFYTNPTKHYMA